MPIYIAKLNRLKNQLRVGIPKGIQDQTKIGDFDLVQFWVEDNRIVMEGFNVPSKNKEGILSTN